MKLAMSLKNSTTNFGYKIFLNFKAVYYKMHTEKKA